VSGTGRQNTEVTEGSGEETEKKGIVNTEARRQGEEADWVTRGGEEKAEEGFNAKEDKGCGAGEDEDRAGCG